MLRRVTLLAAVVAVLTMVVAGAAWAKNITGTSGPDVLKGTDNSDFIQGLRGADQIWGYGSDDELLGNQGADTIRGGTGDDYVDGGPGADTLYGNSGDDEIVGQTGADNGYGGAGNDDLYFTDGVAGNDFVTCGRGYDYVEADYNSDTGTYDQVDPSTCEDVYWVDVA
jgi:Ca2+-binding RTX toxin-like protein